MQTDLPAVPIQVGDSTFSAFSPAFLIQYCHDFLFKNQPVKYHRIFIQVTKARTQFKCSVCDKTLQLLTLKSAQKGKCFKQNFDSALLKTAKSATVRCRKQRHHAVTCSHNHLSCWLLFSMLILMYGL